MADTMQPVKPLAKSLDVDILDGASLSAAVNLQGGIITGIYVPASWTTAALTFQACDTADGTFVDMYDSDGNEISVAIGSSQFVAINPTNFYGVNFIRLRSGTTGTPVNQSGDITLTLKLAAPVVGDAG